MDKVKQVVLLAGGRGTRMRELTESLPKPMVPIGGKPVLDHLIEIFSLFGEFEFLICTGYLGSKIKGHFKNKKNIKVIDTGIDTPTGGRLLNIAEYLDDNFIVTYGDGLANIEIDKLIKFHFEHDKIGTLTSTNPTSKFGLVEFDNNQSVTKFIEKPKLVNNYVNIGFMVFNSKIIEYLKPDTPLEKYPLVNLTKDQQLKAFIHDGFFEPMDTYREYLNLNSLWEKGETPWLRYE
jgi:glucose-1-phosphate cytidylyltransferase